MCVALDILRVGRKKWRGKFYVIVPHKSWLWYAVGDPLERPFFLVAE